MYSFDSRVRYSECDSEFNMTIAGIVDYLQDCTTFHSYDLGVGTEALRNRNRAWLLSSWQIVIDRFPKMNEKIKIGTIPYEFKGIYGLRNFVIFGEDNQALVKANSVWFFYDIENGKPTKIDDIERAAYPIGERIEMDYAPRKITLPDLTITADSVAVTLSMLDTNHHVNNGQYIMLAEQIMKQYLAGKSRESVIIKQIRTEYKRQARLGDTFYPVIGEDGGEFFVDLRSESGDSFATVAFSLAHMTN